MTRQLNWAKQIFLETAYKEEEIIKIKLIHKGYTNISFAFYTNDKKKYQVRIGGSNEIVNRENEKKVLNLINDKNYLYYDKYGNAIKNWIKGKNPKFFINRSKLLKLLLEKINLLHNIDISNSSIIENNSLVFFDLTDWKNNEKHKEKFLELEKEFKELPICLSHNDINPGNIIYHKNNMSLIDFEWSRKNYYYWDIANFLSEVNFSKKWIDKICELDKSYKKDILIKFIYFTKCFSFQWTYGMKETKDLLKYRKLAEKKMNLFYKLLNK